MSVSVNYVSSITVTETLTDQYLSSSDSTLTFNGLNTDTTLTSITSVPVTMHASGRKTMSAGAGTIDLRALPSTNAVSIDGNGLKVQAFKFRNLSTNANNITITAGASNGYLILGTAGSIILYPGCEVQCYLKDQAADIDATHKTIDIAGTVSQILEYEIVMG